MEVQFTDSDVSSFLKDLIEISDTYQVDDSPDKYIRLKSTGEIQTITVEDRNYNLSIFGTASTDSLIINPFAEGESKSVRTSWFYRNGNIGLSILIITIMNTILTKGVEDQKKKNKKDQEENSLDMNVLKYLAPYATDIDEKMLKEFKMVRGDPLKFFNIYYNEKERKGEVSCLLLNPNQKKSYGTVRVKTWAVLEGLFKDILGIASADELTYRPTVIGVPAFESFVNILINIYERILEPLKMIGREIPPAKIGTLKSHLKYFAQYYQRARWCTTVLPTMTEDPKKSDFAVYQGETTVLPNTGVMIPGMAPIGTTTGQTAMPIMSTSVFPNMNSTMIPGMTPVGVQTTPVAPVMSTPQTTPMMQPMIQPTLQPGPVSGFGLTPMGLPAQPIAANADLSSVIPKNPFMRA